MLSVPQLTVLLAITIGIPVVYMGVAWVCIQSSTTITNTVLARIQSRYQQAEHVEAFETNLHITFVIFLMTLFLLTLSYIGLQLPATPYTDAIQFFSWLSVICAPTALIYQTYKTHMTLQRHTAEQTA